MASLLERADDPALFSSTPLPSLTSSPPSCAVGSSCSPVLSSALRSVGLCSQLLLIEELAHFLPCSLKLVF